MLLYAASPQLRCRSGQLPDTRLLGGLQRCPRPLMHDNAKRRAVWHGLAVGELLQGLQRQGKAKRVALIQCAPACPTVSPSQPGARNV